MNTKKTKKAGKSSAGRQTTTATSTQSPSTKGPGTILRSQLNPALMGDGKGKPLCVINTNGFVYEYVGFGWIQLGYATPFEHGKYPKVVED